MFNIIRLIETPKKHRIWCHKSLPLACRSKPSRHSVQKPTRWALVSKMPTASAVVADCHWTHTVSAHVANLIASPANYIPVPCKTTRPTPSRKNMCAPSRNNIRLGAISSHMTWYVAKIADRLIWAVTSKVASISTIVASLFICAIYSKMTLLVAVIAKLNIARWETGSCALPSTMPCLAASMTDTFVRTVTSHVSWFSTIPTNGLGSTLYSNVPVQVWSKVNTKKAKI